MKVALNVDRCPVIPFPQVRRYRVTLANPLLLWTDMPKTIHKYARSLEEAIELCYIDGDVPMGWRVKSAVRDGGTEL